MSGGSYEYLSCEMQDGYAGGKFSMYSGQLLEDLEALLLKVAEGRTDEGFVGRETYANANEAALAIGAAIVRVKAAQRKVEELAAVMRALADVAHDIEWWRSGDWCDSAAADGILEWWKKVQEEEGAR
jgi:hypothetical protein